MRKATTNVSIFRMAPAFFEFLLLLVILGCSSPRKDIVFYAFSDGFMDWYALKLYKAGDFDLHVPSIDYHGTYRVTHDSILLRSIEPEPREITMTVKGEQRTEVIQGKTWIFVMDKEKKVIRSLEGESSYWMKIVKNEL